MSIATFAAPAATKPRKASSVADAVIAAAVDLARDAALEAAGPDEVGEHQGVKAEGHRLATHYFASTARGYRGWHWAVTLARAPRARAATVCEVSLLPGEGAITPPPWVPWSERLQPGDVGRHDLLPYVEDDPRLEPGYAATGDEDADRLAIFELGLGRARVLSREGRAQAATRWYEGDHGPVRSTARQPGRGSDRKAAAETAPAQCSTCGFLLLMAGSLRTTFGVCANEWSPDDGRVVSVDHGCGAHSETDIDRSGSDWPENAPVIDDHGLELVDQHERGPRPAVLEEPVAEVQVPEQPALDVPVPEVQQPEELVLEAPVTEAPAADGPELERSATEAPVVEAPATEAPVTEAAAIQPAATEEHVPDE